MPEPISEREIETRSRWLSQELIRLPAEFKDWLTRQLQTQLTGFAALDATGKLSAGVGVSGISVRSGGVLSIGLAGIGNVGTGEDDLHSYSVAGGTLVANGDSLELEAGGTLVGSTSSKQLRVYFGGVKCFDSGALGISSAADWTLDSLIVRSDTQKFRSIVALTTSSATLLAYSDYVAGTLASGDFTGAQTLKVTGEASGVGAATDDVRQELSFVRWNPI